MCQKDFGTSAPRKTLRKVHDTQMICLKDAIVLDKDGNDVETILGADVADSIARSYQQLDDQQSCF